MELGKSTPIHFEMGANAITVIIATDNKMQIFSSDNVDTMRALVSNMKHKEQFEYYWHDFDSETRCLPELYLFIGKHKDVIFERENSVPIYKLEGEVHMYWDPDSSYMQFDSTERNWPEADCTYITGDDSKILLTVEKPE